MAALGVRVDRAQKAFDGEYLDGIAWLNHGNEGA